MTVKWRTNTLNWRGKSPDRKEPEAEAVMEPRQDQIKREEEHQEEVKEDPDADRIIRLRVVDHGEFGEEKDDHHEVREGFVPDHRANQGQMEAKWR